MEKKLKNGFRFSEIVKITIKIDSSMSKLNICQYFYLPIPIMHGKIFGIKYENSDYNLTCCKDIINPFQMAFRKWCLDNQSP